MMPAGEKISLWTDMFTEFDISKKNLKKFGMTMCLCFFAIGLILFLREERPGLTVERWQRYIIFWSAGFVFLFFAQGAPHTLRPFFKFWMGVAFCLGWLNTRIILIVIYYLVLTPIGLLAKMLKKDFLNLRLEKEAQSYWIRKEQFIRSNEGYEKIF